MSGYWPGSPPENSLQAAHTGGPFSPPAAGTLHRSLGAICIVWHVTSGPRSGARYHRVMCRSVKTLRRADADASDEEIRAAALQFVRKVSGYRVPAQRNTVAFEAAVDEITAASRRLLDGLVAR